MIRKADPYSVALLKTGAGAISLKAGTDVLVANKVVSFPAETPIDMPSLAPGTDYAIWVKRDGTIEASENFIAPPGDGDWLRIGGFHYAPGGNAAAQAGGDTTPAINEYSLWDLKFRPACQDPRGMTLVAGSFWCDIYLLGVDHHLYGTSANNQTIADGASPPKVPLAFGGDGSTTYGSLTWWIAGEVLQSHGKGLLTYEEFAAAAYGVTENQSRGADPVTTGLATTNAGTNADHLRTSRWGVIQATGTLLTWGAGFSQRVGGADYAAAITYGWRNVASGRGQINTQGHEALGAALWGGAWTYGGNSGSRCSAWGDPPSASNNGISVRGRSDHLCLV